MNKRMRKPLRGRKLVVFQVVFALVVGIGTHVGLLFLAHCG